jgi:hypothetical protein
MAGVIDSNVTSKHDHAIWLGGLLVGILMLTIAMISGFSILRLPPLPEDPSAPQPVAPRG